MKPELKLVENTGSQLEAETLAAEPPPLQTEMPFAVVEGEPVTELPRDLYIPPDALQVFLEAFEGPLDLLLYLIRKQNLDILDIPIAEITRQYMYPLRERRDFIGLESRRRRQPPFGALAALHCIRNDEHVRCGEQRRSDGLRSAGDAIAVCPQQPGESREPAVDRMEVAVSGVDQHTRPGVGRELRRGHCGLPIGRRQLAHGRMSRAAAQQEQRNAQALPSHSLLAVRHATQGFSIGPRSMRPVATS